MMSIEHLKFDIFYLNTSSYLPLIPNKKKQLTNQI